MHHFSKIGLAAAALLLGASASAQVAGTFSARAGVTHIAPQVSSGYLSTPSFPGTTVDVGSASALTGGLNYMVTDHWALDLPIGLPFCTAYGLAATCFLWLGPLVGSTLYRRDYALFYPAAYWSFCLLMITADIFYKHYRIQQEQSEKEMEREVHATICEARQLMVSSVAAISQMIDEKDRYTSEHSHRVAEYARLIGAHMGFAGEELDSLYRSALLHDIGKIAVPDAILNKPSRLTDEEFDIMKQHTVWGRKILEGLEFLPQADCGASYHHERFDGKGYPAGLKGGQLPEMVWIISVADALDAMGSDRCYRGHCDRDYMIGEFRKLSGTQFEPAAVKAVVELLESGEIAVQ